MAPAERDREAMDDLDLLLAALPQDIIAAVHALPDRSTLIEVVMDLGRRPEARFPNSEVTLLEREVTEADIAHVVEHIGTFGDDNRAGIERTLHRISAIRNRNGKIVGLTCRIGRAVYGTIEIIGDFVESGKSILIMGRPGIGKTTMLREAARVLADDLGKRVVVVDTSNEIAGDGDIPHPAIGKARRMQVRTPSLQHEVMIEAVENHMPQVIVIDEIGTELEAQAARTIAERGVQLIGTAHGNNLDNLMLNPTLSDLIGGIQSVTLGDEEARRRRTQKSVLERKAPPTFDVIIEIQDRERVMVHGDVAETIDAMLRGDQVAPELRWRDEEGVHRSQAGRGRRRASSSARSGSPGSSVPVSRGGWSPAGAARAVPVRRARLSRSGTRWFPTGYRPGASGGWRQTRGGSGRESAPRSTTEGGQATGPGALNDLDRGVMPGERFAAAPSGTPRGRRRDDDRARNSCRSWPARSPTAVRSSGPPRPRRRPSTRERRDARERERQRAWREQAARAIGALKAEEGTGPGQRRRARPRRTGRGGRPRARVRPRRRVRAGRASKSRRRPTTRVTNGAKPVLHVDHAGSLPTLRVLPQGISRKRLEQAVRELQLPVVIARDVDEADVVMTLKNEYRQKTPMLREAEERAMPIYVLKTNTMPQMQSSLTSIFSLEIDPREAAMRETEEAIDIVLNRSEAVELSPQNAYIRRLQHQMAERANLVSRSRGREPYRRVRLYPDAARAAWR